MFRSEGVDRSDSLNRGVAGYLAFIGGFVNSMGLVQLGTVTSHVTGNVARAALDGVEAGPRVALAPAVLVLMFFVGAFVSSVLLESRRIPRTSARYGVALTVEAAVLVAFFVSSHGWLLSLAMGMQNSLVTRLSGAIVRTTHLTGVITDLGIEAARWWHWLSHRASERPPPAKAALLGTIASAFIIGALGGTTGALEFGQAAVVVPVLALAIGAVYALFSRR